MGGGELIGGGVGIDGVRHADTGTCSWIKKRKIMGTRISSFKSSFEDCFLSSLANVLALMISILWYIYVLQCPFSSKELVNITFKHLSFVNNFTIKIYLAVSSFFIYLNKGKYISLSKTWNINTKYITINLYLIRSINTHLI